MVAVVNEHIGDGHDNRLKPEKHVWTELLNLKSRIRTLAASRMRSWLQPM